MGLFNMFQKEKICTSFAYHCACRKRNSRLPVGALCMFEFSLFSFFFSFFPQTSRQGSLNRDVIFKMSFKKACFRLINGPTIHLRLRKGNKNTVFFNNLRGRVTRKVCLDLRFFRLREFLAFFFFFFLFSYTFVEMFTRIQIQRVFTDARELYRFEKQAQGLLFVLNVFKDGDIILVNYACLNERRSKKWPGIGKFRKF